MTSAPLPLNGRDRLAALGLAAVVLVAGGFRMAPKTCGIFHDDAIYVTTAKALAEGEGYRLIGVPEAPRQTKYPPLYPTLLAAVWWVWPSFPDNLLAMQGLTLLAGAAAVGLGYLYLVRFDYFPRGVAAAGALCATAPAFLYFCTQTMAEMPFALLLIVALWALDGHLLSPAKSRRAQFGLGVVLALPFLCRTIGAPLVPVALWLLYRSGRPLRWCAAGAVTAALPWVLWSLAGRGVWDANPVNGYYTDYAGCWSSTGVGMLGRVFYWNTLLLAYSSADLSLEGLCAGAGPYPAPWQTALLLLLGFIPWLGVALRLPSRKALPWALAAYLMTMLVWSWPPYRFLVPILPLLAAYFFAAPAGLLRRLLSPSIYRRVAPVGLGVIVVANLALLARHAGLTRESGFPVLRLNVATVSWSPYERTFAWLRRHAHPDDVVASGLDSMIALYTERKAFRPFVYRPGNLFYGEEGPALGTVEEFASVLKRYRPRYLVQVPMPGFAEEKPFEELLGELRRQHPGWLVPVYQDEDPRFVVFELDPDKEAAVIARGR